MIKIIYPADRTFIINDMEGTTEEQLEKVFAGFNGGSGQEFQIFLDSGCRSMSVNDFVCINDQWYQCASVGWNKVTRNYLNIITEQVENKVNNLTNNAWSVLNDIMFDINYKPLDNNNK